MTEPSTVERASFRTTWTVSDSRLDARAAGALRRSFGSWLETVPRSDDRANDILLALYEALANTVEHAYGDNGGYVHVDASYRPVARRLELEVADRGAWNRPTPTSLRGNGLRLMRAVADSFDITADAAGTCVCLVFDLDTET